MENFTYSVARQIGWGDNAISKTLGDFLTREAAEDYMKANDIRVGEKDGVHHWISVWRPIG